MHASSKHQESSVKMACFFRNQAVDLLSQMQSAKAMPSRCFRTTEPELPSTSPPLSEHFAERAHLLWQVGRVRRGREASACLLSQVRRAGEDGDGRSRARVSRVESKHRSRAGRSLREGPEGCARLVERDARLGGARLGDARVPGFSPCRNIHSKPTLSRFTRSS